MSQIKAVWFLYALSVTLGALGAASALFVSDWISWIFALLGVAAFLALRTIPGALQTRGERRSGRRSGRRRASTR